MASQEFLASFAVDIDEGGVSRLQSILSDNRDLANEVAAAFEAATAAIREYEAAASRNTGGSGEGNRDTGSAAGSANTWTTTVRNDVRGQLMGSLYGEEGSIRDWYLGNIEEYAISTATRDADSLRENLVSWDQAGLSSDPTKSERSSEYAALQEQAYAVLSEPIARARQYMQEALDAEAEGADTQEYVDKVIETLREPLQQVKEMYDSFTFEDDAESNEGNGTAEEGTASGMLDLESARADLSAFREEAAEPVSLSANASGIVSAASAALSSIRSMFSSPISVKAQVQTETGNGDESASTVKMSAGGRFSKPTDVQVAEDGDAEYIIPVKKEDRAIPLLRQLLSELSPAARQSLSLGDAALPLSGGLLAGSASAAQITQNNSNVSAPVTIQVHATGAGAEQIGQSLYDTAERYLLRTLRGAMA